LFIWPFYLCSTPHDLIWETDTKVFEVPQVITSSGLLQKHCPVIHFIIVHTTLFSYTKIETLSHMQYLACYLTNGAQNSSFVRFQILYDGFIFLKINFVFVLPPQYWRCWHMDIITNNTYVNNYIICNMSRRLLLSLGSYDRASWAKYEKRKTNKMQQLDVYY